MDNPTIEILVGFNKNDIVVSLQTELTPLGANIDDEIWKTKVYGFSLEFVKKSIFLGLSRATLDKMQKNVSIVNIDNINPNEIKWNL